MMILVLIKNTYLTTFRNVFGDIGHLSTLKHLGGFHSEIIVFHVCPGDILNTYYALCTLRFKK